MDNVIQKRTTYLWLEQPQEEAFQNVIFVDWHLVALLHYYLVSEVCYQHTQKQWFWLLWVYYHPEECSVLEKETKIVLGNMHQGIYRKVYGKKMTEIILNLTCSFIFQNKEIYQLVEWGKLKVILISYYEYIFFTQVFFIYPEVIHNNASIKIDIWKCKIWEVVEGKTFLVNAFFTWRNICATKLYLYVTSGYGEVSINTTNVVWDKVVTMQPNTTIIKENMKTCYLSER